MAQPETQFNAEKIKKATLNASVQQPVAVYPTSVGVLAGAYALAFGLNPVVAGLCLGGLALGTGGWLFEYFVRGKTHALRIVNRLRDELAQKRRAAIERIRGELNELNHTEALQQLDTLIRKFQNFETVLGKKLDVGELTYNRYLAMAEQVFLNSLDNLEQLAFGLQSVAAVDMDSINERLRTTADEEHERAPLLERAQLWHDQHKKADELLLENEHAMTQLDRVSARLAEIRTREGHAQMDMENAMAELENLISKASQYERR
jgi:hypothetical protein